MWNAIDANVQMKSLGSLADYRRRRGAPPTSASR